MNDKARVYSAPLPEASRLRRAVESLGLVLTGRDRDRPAMLAGLLAGMTEQYLAGIRGSDQQTEYMYGWLATLDHDERRVLATLSLRLRDAEQFAEEALPRVPQAGRQLRIAVLALNCATWAVAAAAEIAGHDGKEDLEVAGEYSGKAVDGAAALHNFMQALEQLAAEQEAGEAHPDKERTQRP